MKNTLSIKGGNRALLFTIAIALAAGILLVSCGGGGYGGGGGGGTAPGMFTLTSPSDGEPGVSTTPNLTWTASTGAIGYYVDIKTPAEVSYTRIATVMAPTTNYQIASALTALTIYDWQITAYNYYGTMIAGPQSFATGP
jgi:hypothetical protein